MYSLIHVMQYFNLLIFLLANDIADLFFRVFWGERGGAGGGSKGGVINDQDLLFTGLFLPLVIFAPLHL